MVSYSLLVVESLSTFFLCSISARHKVIIGCITDYVSSFLAPTFNKYFQSYKRPIANNAPHDPNKTQAQKRESPLRDAVAKLHNL